MQEKERDCITYYNEECRKKRTDQKQVPSRPPSSPPRQWPAIFILSLHQHAPYRPCPQHYSKVTQTQVRGTISQYGFSPCLQYAQQLVRIFLLFPVGHRIAHLQHHCSHCDIHDVHRSPTEELSKADTSEGCSKDHGDVRQTRNIQRVIADKLCLSQGSPLCRLFSHSFILT